ncbi:hypothetical protein BJX63DRAFT_136892 [Aspergillus granulosus]|uniref:Uncharacterized protein n=1 Tax=Aspergillus granulosus TaxID=176169 RepID=A0ABR4HLV5_9EURO
MIFSATTTGQAMFNPCSCSQAPNAPEGSIRHITNWWSLAVQRTEAASSEGRTTAPRHSSTMRPFLKEWNNAMQLPVKPCLLDEHLQRDHLNCLASIAPCVARETLAAPCTASCRQETLSANRLLRGHQLSAELAAPAASGKTEGEKKNHKKLERPSLVVLR